jgi:hypothetical protein
MLRKRAIWSILALEIWPLGTEVSTGAWVDLKMGLKTGIGIYSLW